ncbi:hypothetical protein DICVIV_03456 [Dictyocaulus viviparus]|uniref:Uncharacterized protein n=1 Tax=Dictyocaulus viviparus TaxID=29172 RepID=A0A0D8Y721_DICVI|nr:hypothetical protein DICVIV_03456 [Dictyocaulus viviparus]
MNTAISVFLVLCVTRNLLNSSKLRVKRYTSRESVEERIEEGYQLLRSEPHAADTKAVLLQLHVMEKEIEGELALSSKQQADLLEDMKEYVDTVFDHVQPIGDIIPEINRHSNVDMALYQGDIMLTKFIRLSIFL